MRHVRLEHAASSHGTDSKTPSRRTARWSGWFSPKARTAAAEGKWQSSIEIFLVSRGTVRAILPSNMLLHRDTHGTQQALLDDLSGDRRGIVEEPARRLSRMTANLAEIHRILIGLRGLTLVLAGVVVLCVGTWTALRVLATVRRDAPAALHRIAEPPPLPPDDTQATTVLPPLTATPQHGTIWRFSLAPRTHAR